MFVNIRSHEANKNVSHVRLPKLNNILFFSSPTFSLAAATALQASPSIHIVCVLLSPLQPYMVEEKWNIREEAQAAELKSATGKGNGKRKVSRDLRRAKKKGGKGSNKRE